MTEFTLACLTPELVTQRPRTHIEDAIEYQSPDAVCLVGPTHRPRAQVLAQQLLPDDIPLLYPALTTGVDTIGHDVFDIIVLGDDGDHETLAEALAAAHRPLVISNQFDLSIDTESLQTSLDVVGDGDWPPQNAPDNTLVLSGRIDGDYEHTWDGIQVHGIAPVDQANGSDQRLPYLTISSDDTVSSTFLSSGRLGLRAIPGVGRGREETLNDANYETRADLAAATKGELTSLRGIGEKTANKYLAHADAFVNETVVRTSDAQVPVSDPIFFDIETDGLNPSVIWQIGAYDQAADEYVAFLQKDPSNPGGAVKSFCDWLAGQDNNALVAWNGWGFDFPHLERFVKQYVPEHESTLGRTYFFDPLKWCVDNKHAALPGRSNKLDVVAAALGYDRADTGLDGEQVGKLYRRWMMSQSDETELDWERHIQYCKDDVYGLAHVFRKIAAAGRIESTPSSNQTGQTTEQGSLSDF